MSHIVRLVEQDGGSDAVLHCIFCRVEVLTKDANDGFLDNVKTNELGLYTFDF